MSDRDERELANMIVGITGANVAPDASLRDLLAAAYAKLVENFRRDEALKNAIAEWQNRG